MGDLWPGLLRFLDDPRLTLDNNATERALRGVVLGRKNHYGSRSERGRRSVLQPGRERQARWRRTGRLLAYGGSSRDPRRAHPAASRTRYASSLRHLNPARRARRGWARRYHRTVIYLIMTPGTAGGRETAIQEHCVRTSILLRSRWTVREGRAQRRRDGSCPTMTCSCGNRS
jgi:hypothetical protein